MNNPFDYFDAIYCINLDERTDRWEHSLKQFEKLGISDRVERFSAIRPEMDERWDRWVPWGNQWKYPLVGAVGASGSHKAVIQLAKERGLDNVLVFEDDFVVLDNWEENVKCALDDLSSHKWHLFYLGYHLQKTQGMERSWGRCLRQCHSKRKRGIQLAVGLAYNSSIFDYLIEKIDPFNYQRFGRQGHIDKFYSRTRYIKKFFVQPMVVEPDWSFGSDVNWQGKDK